MKRDDIMVMNSEMREIGERAQAAKKVLAALDSTRKNALLEAIADNLCANAEKITAENKKDIANAAANNLSAALIERLTLDEKRIGSMAEMFRNVARLPEPVGKILSGMTHPNGMKITKITVPLGVIAIIYESRPNVTADSSALCFKSGNAVILKGGSEAVNSNAAIVDIIRGTLEREQLPPDCVQLVIDDKEHTLSKALMRMNEYIDVIIPRGGAGLIGAVLANSTVPVIETGVGNCHIYIDKNAQIDMAVDIVFNAKTSRPSVCNACETLLLHKDIAAFALLRIKENLDKKNVKIVGDETVCRLMSDAVAASEEDWSEEYLDYKLAVKVVKSIDEAIAHIGKYGTKHSEAIITENYAAAEKFLSEIDAAAVYVNASTRFTDGEEFGFGAEIGISTQKLHARGPVGLCDLISYKYLIRGNGQIRK